MKGFPFLKARDGVRVVLGLFPGARALFLLASRRNIWPRVLRANPKPSMIGEEFIQPPLCVADTIFPSLSTASRWVVSPWRVFLAAVEAASGRSPASHDRRARFMSISRPLLAAYSLERRVSRGTRSKSGSP